jgi:beta-lactamase class C
MKKTTYILAILPITIILIIFLDLSSTGATEPAPDATDAIDAAYAPKVEKMLTRADSIVMQYDTLLTNLLENAGTVGAAAVITINGEIVFMKSYGLKEAGTSERVNENTIFRLASVSKPVTGTLARILDNEGTIRLDDRVIDHLAGFRLKDTASTNNLTIRHLLSHTSGLVPHAYDNLVEAHVPFREIMDSLFRVNISAPPGILYGYQNVMYSLYDTIARLKTGKSFNQLLRDKMFDPLGMENASAGYAPFLMSENKALPHARTGSGFRSIRINDRYYSTNPAAGINASISDMGKFLSALTGPDPHALGPFLVDSVFAPEVVSPLRWIYLRQWDRVDSKHYGLGWRIIGYKGRQVAYHGGYVSGYRAEFAVCREEGIGIAFLTNSPGRVGSRVVPDFLDMWFDSIEVPERIYLTEE